MSKVLIGDIWRIRLARDWVVVPVNIGWRKNGANVMGRGVAAQAARNCTDLPAWYGALCLQYGADTPVLAHPGHRLIMFPTKPLLNPQMPQMSWKGPSTIERVRKSLGELGALPPHLPWKGRILLPAVGCGNGGLDPAVVVPELVEWAEGRQDTRIVLDEKTAAKVPCPECCAPVKPWTAPGYNFLAMEVCRACNGSETLLPKEPEGGGKDLAEMTWEVVNGT